MCYVQSTRISYGLWGHSPSEIRYRDPQVLSSALATLGTLQPEPSGLNHVDSFDSVSNYYILILLSNHASYNFSHWYNSRG